MNDNDYFDAHCHIFTLNYALKEVKNMLHDMLYGTYPWHSPTINNAKMLTMPDWSGIKDLLKQFYELISASMGSEEENLNFLQSEALKAIPNIKWNITPLMMDIFYLLAYPLNKGENASQMRSAMTKHIDENEFQKVWNEILDDLKTHIRERNSQLKITKNDTVKNVFEVIESEKSIKKTFAFKSKTIESIGFYQTEGFCFHLNNLISLEKKRKGELFPFIAVDPRRPGMIDEIISGKYISNNGPFYGVKLYPRMGYHPQSAPMEALYNYCNDQKIPITFHCGKSGFPPSAKWKYADFGNPINFEPIIKRYQNLKINFAHLGSSDPTYNWANTIINMVNQYDNVYSDLACYVDINDLEAAKVFWDNNPKLKSRLLFGTDFDVMYFTGEITMSSYYKNFKRIFSAHDLTLLMHDNPLRFFEDICKVSANNENTFFSKVKSRKNKKELSKIKQ